MPPVESTLGPVARMPLSLEIADRLRTAILSGELAVDAELPTEAELSRTFEVGRSTVREALRVLQSQGLVTGAETVSTTRPRVTHARTAPTAASALQVAMQVGAVPLTDLVGLRVLVEAEAMRGVRMVPAAAREGLVVMRAAAEAGDVDAFHLADVDFHLALAHAGGNKAIALVVEVLRGSIASYLGEALRTFAEPTPVLEKLCEEHEAIVTALDDGAGDRAADLIVAHIHDFYSPDVRQQGNL